MAAVIAVAVLLALLFAGLSTAGTRGRPASSAPVGAGAHAAGGAGVPALVRPVLCFTRGAGPAPAPVASLPGSCPAPYAVTANSVQPLPPASGAGGTYRVHVVPDDPALGGVATSAHDVASHVVLLPFADPARGRLLLGPAVLALSKSTVRTVRVGPGPNETWTVRLALSPGASVQLDRVAFRYFHTYLAVDVGGRVVGDPLIEPAQVRFSSLEGHLDLVGHDIGGLSGSAAKRLAAAVGR